MAFLDVGKNETGYPFSDPPLRKQTGGEQGHVTWCRDYIIMYPPRHIDSLFLTSFAGVYSLYPAQIFYETFGQE